MNSPSPLVPQGSSLEQQHQARSSLKVKIFCALGVNVAVLLVLLMQGCKREQPQTTAEQSPMFTDTNPPPMDMSDTNVPYAAVDTNTPPPPPQVPVVAPTPLPAAAASEYTILKGDTFSTIAPKFGVSTKALQAANPGVDPSKLQIGKKIVIPVSSAAVAPPDAASVGAPVGDSGGLYKVKSGDTLSKIATAHHTTVKAIQSANNLSDSRIKVGQLLKLPTSPTPAGATPAVPAP
jgi:LysM repeat protein